MKTKYALFIGRWQPFHKGHEWLINQKLQYNIPVCIAIRDMPVDKFNILTTVQVHDMLKYIYLFNRNIKIIVIPDIESVNYGRGVGYEIIEHNPPENIKVVNATEIRYYLSSPEAGDFWKNLMPFRAIEWWTNYYKK